jgi:hypothetical protein
MARFATGFQYLVDCSGRCNPRLLSPRCCLVIQPEHPNPGNAGGFSYAIERPFEDKAAQGKEHSNSRASRSKHGFAAAFIFDFFRYVYEDLFY